VREFLLLRAHQKGYKCICGTIPVSTTFAPTPPAQFNFQMKNTTSDVSTLAVTPSKTSIDPRVAKATDSEFELGLWLSGLDSFLDSGSGLFADRIGSPRSRDWTSEVQVVRSTLILCSKLTDTLLGSASRPRSISRDDLDELAARLRDAIILTGALVKRQPLDFGEWRACSSVLFGHLGSLSAFNTLVRHAEKVGESDMPDKLREILDSHAVSLTERTDLRAVVTRYSKARRWLLTLEEMLQRDEPLKHGVLIFARVHEQLSDVIRYINNRLTRFDDEDAELFRLLDSASYTSAHELRKVFEEELAGIIGIRPSPSVYAQIGTATALLKDGIEQVLMSFARLVEPAIEPTEIFPHLREKFEFSLLLRDELAGLTADVKAREKDPSPDGMAELNRRLADFCGRIMPALYYKDRESFERFAEEIRLTSNKSDLVPILHRFGAYLETLFGHVNNRTILSGYPFKGETAD